MSVCKLSLYAMLAALFTLPALAVNIATINRLPQDTVVQVTGTVIEVRDSNSFILADGTGQMVVNTHKPFHVNEGNPVTVRGYVEPKPQQVRDALDHSRIVFISYHTNKTPKR